MAISPTATRPRGRTSSARQRWAVTSRTPGASTTCTATYCSGARIGTKTRTKATLHNVLHAAGSGSSTPRTAGLPGGYPSSPRLAAPASGFGWSFGCVRPLRNDEPAQQQSVPPHLSAIRAAPWRIALGLAPSGAGLCLPPRGSEFPGVNKNAPAEEHTARCSLAGAPLNIV